jgi:hypothetical protein
VLRRGDLKEVAFGLFLVVLAAVAFFATAGLSVGTAADMGPGFVPRALAWVILGFGAAFCVTGLLKAAEPFPELAWRPLAAILAGIAVFALLFASQGLVIAAIGSVLVSGTAAGPVHWRRLALFGIVLAAFSALLFVKGLGLPFRVWPAWAQPLLLLWPW